MDYRRWTRTDGSPFRRICNEVVKDMDTIVLVGCGKSKEPDKQPSWRLYRKTYFESKMTAAMVIGVPFIASAKYGLVRPDDRIEPYDETLRNASDSEKQEWGSEVVDEIPERFDQAVVLAGRDYAEPIKANVSSDFTVYDPFQAFGGNGKQMGWCLDAVDRLMAGESLTDVLPEQ